MLDNQLKLWYYNIKYVFTSVFSDLGRSFTILMFTTVLSVNTASALTDLLLLKQLSMGERLPNLEYQR